MRLNEVSNGIRESWKSEVKLTNKNQEGELQVNSGGHGALPETYKLKVNQKVIHDSIRSTIPSETLIMHEPCIADFFVNGESAGVVDNTKILEDWLMHIDCLLEKAECEKSLEIDDADLTHLFVRKSTILCSLGFFESAKDFAQQAIDILESSMGYYRLAIAQYCLKEYDYALETLLLATNLDGLNFHIQHALQVVLTRIRSRKDRPELFEEDHE